MRVVVGVLITVLATSAQFRTNVPLVVAPTTVKNAKEKYVDGLTAQDLILYDNNVPQAIQMDWTVNPISLVIAVQTSASSAPILDKFGGSGILFSQLLAGETGETAVVSFAKDVQLRQDFTSDTGAVAHALLALKAQGKEASALDAIMLSLELLRQRPPARRRILVVIGEKRDRSSRAKLPQVIQEVQRQNASIYWLTWSPSLTAFTHRPPRRGDRETPEEKRQDRKRDDPVPAPDPPSENLLRGFTELAQLSKPDLAGLFAQITGARSMSFVKKSALEQAIRAVGEEVHRQYILTFQPQSDEEGRFHKIRVVIKGRPDLRVRTRTGYWSVSN